MKLIAVLNVVAWGGFWAFGYIALTTEPGDAWPMITVLLLAVAGAGVGLWAYLRLVRASARAGYARPPKLVLAGHAPNRGAGA